MIGWIDVAVPHVLAERVRRHVNQFHSSTSSTTGSDSLADYTPVVFSTVATCQKRALRGGVAGALAGRAKLPGDRGSIVDVGAIGQFTA